MRHLLMILALLVTSRAIGQDVFISKPSGSEHNEALFQAYKNRLNERRSVALSIRREMNAGKVHRYWTAIPVTVDVFGGRPAIERGWVIQPPIYRSYDLYDYAQDRLSAIEAVLSTMSY